jgi:hypothetical protein
MTDMMQQMSKDLRIEKQQEKKVNWITYQIVNFVVEEKMHIPNKEYDIIESLINRFLSPYANIRDLKENIIEEYKSIMEKTLRGYFIPYLWSYNVSTSEFYTPVNYVELIAINDTKGFKWFKDVLAKMDKDEFEKFYIELYSLKHPIITKLRYGSNLR